MDVLMALIFPIQEHRVSFHFFVLSEISFISILWFSEFKSFTSLVKFLPRHFILFGAILNWVVFLLSLSDSSLLVYRKATDFYILILYPGTLLNLCISSNCFFLWRLRVLCIYLVICKYWLFYLFLSNLDAFFISFSSLIAVPRTSKTMLNRSGKSGHPCLVPDFRGKTFSFSSLRRMLAMGLL